MVVKSKVLPIASAFSSAGVGMAGYVAAGFTPAYALEKDTAAAMIFDANHRYDDGTSVINVASIEETQGKHLVDQIERLTGSRIIPCLEQGPVCQDYTSLNTSGSDFGRRTLMLEAIRLIEEAAPLTAVIEEVQEFLEPKHSDVSDEYFRRVAKMDYESAYMVMNTLHYGSNQARERFIHIFVHKSLKKQPIFPRSDTINVKRVRDFLDIDYFFSGHFSDKIKTKNHFMCTVTSGSPKYFYKGSKRWKPTVKELMLCCDLDPESFKLAGSETTQRIAFGNGIPAKLTYHIGKTIIDEILCVKKDKDGFWIPK